MTTTATGHDETLSGSGWSAQCGSFSFVTGISIRSGAQEKLRAGAVLRCCGTYGRERKKAHDYGWPSTMVVVVVFTFCVCVMETQQMSPTLSPSIDRLGKLGQPIALSAEVCAERIRRRRRRHESEKKLHTITSAKLVVQ